MSQPAVSKPVLNRTVCLSASRRVMRVELKGVADSLGMGSDFILFGE